MINVNMTDKAGVTLATAGKYCADNVKVTPSAEILRKDEQAKTATPTTSAQDITPDAGKALSKVTVNPITADIVGDLDADSFAPAIVSAIEGKGVTVPDGTLLDGMADLIESIEAGGGGGGTGYNFDGNPRWVSSGEFTVSETVSVSTIEPILFNPEVMDGEQSDWNRGRFFLLFDATKVEKPYVNSSPAGNTLNGVAAIINYAYSYSTNYPNKEYTVYFYVGGRFLLNEIESGHSTYDQISFASTSRKFISGHRYCWVAWGMKAGNEA